jgi:hypothetical protein
MARLYWYLAVPLLIILPVSHGFVSQSRGEAGAPALMRKTMMRDGPKLARIIISRTPLSPPRVNDNINEIRYRQQAFTLGAAAGTSSSTGGGGGAVDGSSSSASLQTLAYVATSLAYTAIAAIIFLMPDKTRTVQLERKLGGACGFGLAAALSNILAVASARSRLAQGAGVDSYKKLNLGLIAFCAIGLFAVPGESAFTPLTIPATLLAGFMSMVRVLGGVTAYFGWRAGVKKNASIVEELAVGVQSTKESLDLEKSHKGWFYKYSTVFVAFGVLTNMMLIGRSKLDFDISLEVSAIARLFLIASMLLTLKDADDKEQLSGKTFVQMNFMLAAWAFIGALRMSAGGRFSPLWFTYRCRYRRRCLRAAYHLYRSRSYSRSYSRSPNAVVMAFVQYGHSWPRPGHSAVLVRLCIRHAQGKNVVCFLAVLFQGHEGAKGWHDNYQEVEGGCCVVEMRYPCFLRSVVRQPNQITSRMIIHRMHYVTTITNKYDFIWCMAVPAECLLRTVMHQIFQGGVNGHYRTLLIRLFRVH